MSCIPLDVLNEGSGFTVMYRIEVDGENAVQADVSTIEFAIINDETKGVIQALTALTVADVVFDTLQLDNMWTEDNWGYNFKHTASHALLTDVSVTYRLEYKVSLVGGAQYFLSPKLLKLSEIYSN
jgi:hypothetical protein